MIRRGNIHSGRRAARIVAQIRERIVAGGILTGQYLPGVRETALEHRVSPETARRAIKILEAD